MSLSCEPEWFVSCYARPIQYSSRRWQRREVRGGGWHDITHDLARVRSPPCNLDVRAWLWVQAPDFAKILTTPPRTHVTV